MVISSNEADERGGKPHDLMVWQLSF